MNKLAIASGVALLVLSTVAEAQWVMLARRAVGRVEQMSQQSPQAGGANYDSAAVMLDAPAPKVYAAVVQGLKNNTQGLTITREDPGAMLVQFTNGQQIAGIKVARVVLTSSGNAGGSVTANFGFAVAPTAYGSALTTLQSANTLDVAIATVQAGPILLANDDLQIVGVANTTTTLQTLTGFIDYSMTAP
jgi:hypothetical protein